MAAQPNIIPLHPEVADSLALAMAAASDAPLLLLDGDLTVVAASESFCQAFDIDLSSVRGRHLSELGSGEWAGRQVDALLRATASGSAAVDDYEMDLVRPGSAPRHLVLHARKLAYGDDDNTRMLLSITDVTETRANEKLKDDLLREKAILLQELQHRIANSLQIISSVLLQSARRGTSEEARGQLKDAHHRIMSVAAVQRQLARSTLGTVQLRPYLTELCQSIGASMIRDHSQVSLSVTADDGVSTSEVSISLGLIVTELVINSLKHAFPNHRHGKIAVDYLSDGDTWRLSVSDDGVGIPSDPAAAKAGLGTSIVEALAKQLQAAVEVTDAGPGTATSIIHPLS